MEMLFVCRNMRDVLYNGSIELWPIRTSLMTSLFLYIENVHVL